MTSNKRQAIRVIGSKARSIVSTTPAAETIDPQTVVDALGAVPADKPKPAHLGNSRYPLCPECGWAVQPYFTHECDPLANATASRLEASAYQRIPRTRFGFGDRMLTFQVSNRLDIRFAISRHASEHADLPDDPAIHMRDIAFRGDLSVSEAADLVNTLTDWHARVMQQRKEKTP